MFSQRPNKGTHESYVQREGLNHYCLTLNACTSVCACVQLCVRSLKRAHVYFLSELFGTSPHSPVSAHLFDSHSWFWLQPTCFDPTIRILTVHYFKPTAPDFDPNPSFSDRYPLPPLVFDYLHTVLTHHTLFRSHLVSTNDSASCICATSTPVTRQIKSHKRRQLFPSFWTYGRRPGPGGGWGLSIVLWRSL